MNYINKLIVKNVAKDGSVSPEDVIVEWNTWDPKKSANVTVRGSLEDFRSEIYDAGYSAAEEDNENF